jgi:hypothetical protein
LLHSGNGLFCAAGLKLQKWFARFYPRQSIRYSHRAGEFAALRLCLSVGPGQSESSIWQAEAATLACGLVWCLSGVAQFVKELSVKGTIEVCLCCLFYGVGAQGWYASDNRQKAAMLQLAVCSRLSKPCRQRPFETPSSDTFVSAAGRRVPNPTGAVLVIDA